jgi:xanthine/uracil permease
MPKRWRPPLLARNTLWYPALRSVPVILGILVGWLLVYVRGCAF